MNKRQEFEKLEKLVTKSNIEGTIELFRPEYKENLSKDGIHRFGNDCKSIKKHNLKGKNLFDEEARLSKLFIDAYEKNDRDLIDNIPIFWGNNHGLNSIIYFGCTYDYSNKNHDPQEFSNETTTQHLGWIPFYFNRIIDKTGTTPLYNSLIKTIEETQKGLKAINEKIFTSPRFQKAIKKHVKLKNHKPTIHAHHDMTFNYKDEALDFARRVEKIYSIASDITTGISV